MPGLQLLQIALWIGLAPQVHRQSDLLHLNLAVRQASDIRSFILTPDRNAETWFSNFQMVWPVAGHYMRLFGVGINQARFFCLLMSALALPFIGLSARRLYGNTAAFCAVAVGIAIPLQYNWVRADGWVATATAIALYAMLRAKDPGRFRLWSFISGVAATSAVEGHVYGGAFSVTFCVLWLLRWLRDRRQGESGATQAFGCFVAGCLIFTLLWASYHIALPGTALSDVPDLLRETWEWEVNTSNPTGQVGLTPANTLLQLKIYLYSAPAELILLAIVLVAALIRRNAADRLLLSLAGGALAIVGLFLAHVNDFYLVFAFPFFAIWFGAWLARFFREGAEHSAQGINLSFAGLFVLLAAILLYALFAHARSLEHGLLTHRAQLREMERIGREIDAMLPPADVVVAGDPGYYPGMPQRLNFASSFSFTWGLPKYQAFGDPEAVIVTPGVDDDWPHLGAWLGEREFQPARCFSGHDLGEGVTILYLSPELMPPQSAIDCTPEDLALLQDAA